MRLNDFELVIANVLPCYWYEEGNGKEEFYIDEQNCDYHKFIDSNIFNNNEKETRKWWKIMLYKPSNVKDITKETYPLCKWLVEDSYHSMRNIYDNDDDDIDYEKYEWDFTNHCIKRD